MNNSLKKKTRPIAALLAAAAIAGFVVVNLASPSMGASAEANMQFAHVKDRFAGQTPQALDVQAAGTQQLALARDGYSSTQLVTAAPTPTVTAQQPVTTGASGSSASKARKTTASAPAAPAPSPGSAKAYAKSLLSGMGMGNDQYSCLVSLWNRESGWNVYASNPSGAYGIPQALPGSKMASAGPNWQSDFQTQVKWGLGYVDGRYGTPCGAWAHSQATGWY